MGPIVEEARVAGAKVGQCGLGKGLKAVEGEDVAGAGASREGSLLVMTMDVGGAVAVGIQSRSRLYPSDVEVVVDWVIGDGGGVLVGANCEAADADGGSLLRPLQISCTWGVGGRGWLYIGRDGSRSGGFG